MRLCLRHPFKIWSEIMLKGIIFDMDGVLINSEPVHYRIWKEALLTRGVELDYEVYKPCIGSTIEFLMNLLHDAYGIDREDKALIATMKKIKKETVEREGIPMIEGVPDLLRRLKSAGYKMAIASSSPLSYIQMVTKRLKIDHYFDKILSGENVKHPKPEPDVFLAAAKALELDTSECLIIEDSTNGCRAAKAAGITCMGYFNPDSGKQDLSQAAMVIEGYDEIDAKFMEKVYCHNHHLPAVVCETKRLLVREMSEKDLPEMLALNEQNSTENSVEGNEKTLEEELENFPNYRRYMYELCDMGYWAVVEKQSGKIIGRAGIEPKVWNQGRSVVELGYLIDGAYQRQGYGYEACSAIISEAEERGAKYLYCRIHSENKPSIGLAKKLGFSKTDYHVEQDAKEIEVYRYVCENNSVLQERG